MAKCCYTSYRLNTKGGSEFHRVGATTEKALIPTFVLTLGTKGRLELDDQSCLAGSQLFRPKQIDGSAHFTENRVAIEFSYG